MVTCPVIYGEKAFLIHLQKHEDSDGAPESAKGDRVIDFSTAILYLGFPRILFLLSSMSNWRTRENSRVPSTAYGLDPDIPAILKASSYCKSPTSISPSKTRDYFKSFDLQDRALFHI